jgi:hypothetical protein
LRRRTTASRFATILTLAAAITFVPSQASAQRNLFEKIGDLFGGRPAVVAEPVNPPNPANEAIKDERRGRLTANTGAMIAWIDSVCKLTADQKTAVAAVLDKEVDRSQKAWLAQPNRGNAAGDRDFIPLEFNKTIRKVTHLNRVQRGITDALDEKQQALFKTAWAEREEDLRDGFLSFALLVLDSEMYLTPDQREPVKLGLVEMFGERAFHGLFGFRASSWPYTRAPFTSRQKVMALLGDVRVRRYDRLTKSGGQGDRSVSIQMGTGNGEKAFTDAVADQPKRLAEAMAVRIEHLEQTEGISKVQARGLELAAKGASKRVINDWVERCERQLQSMREQFGEQRVTWGMSLPTPLSVERESLWQTTLRKVQGPQEKQQSKPKTKEEHKQAARQSVKNFLDAALNVPREKSTKPKLAMTERQQFHRDALTDYVMAVISQELWLRPGQRPELRKLVDGSLEDFDRYNKYFDYSELQILADVLLVTPREPLEEILDAEQLVAWKSLRAQFKLKQNGRTFSITYNFGELQVSFIGRKRELAVWPSDTDAKSNE